MKVVVTGAAGFIGSTLVDRLLADGLDVIGIDSFTSYYSRETKIANLGASMSQRRFRLIDADLVETDLHGALADASCVFHLAGQPGVRASWSDGFDSYVRNNIVATHRVLEAARLRPGLRVVYSSSSSIYGNAERYPTLESDTPAPVSPYGMTKLAGEHLCSLYASTWGVPTIALRYFTVFGPRQRPDMATHRLIVSALNGTPFPMYGDGTQLRSFTYVDDIVDATVRAGFASQLEPGAVFNAAGNDSCSLLDMIALVAEHAGRTPNIEQRGDSPGDALRTGGSTAALQAALGWSCHTNLSDGVAAQVESVRARATSASLG